jgi:hypothetical protein
MAHCRLLFVGGSDNLQKIFDNTPDSSSETAAEMTLKEILLLNIIVPQKQQMLSEVVFIV